MFRIVRKIAIGIPHHVTPAWRSMNEESYSFRPENFQAVADQTQGSP
jgi:hypothetical protein